MEKASQDKREKNASYQPEMHVRNANSREIFKNNRLTSQFLRNYTDIPLLANHLLRQAADRHKPFVRAFSTDAMKRLMAASWPGNVRQLVNVIEQCVALTSSPVISDALVEQALEGENTALPTFAEARNQFELNYLRKLLQITKGNVTHAARMAGRNRTEFYKLLSRHELEANDFKE